VNGRVDDSFTAVIGLEVHVQLQTRSKIFCACELDPHAAPNTRVCPVCLGQPGTLPVLNRQAVRLALRLALACGCEIAPLSSFARKNYFYPDLPKGYQITQYAFPLARGGALEVDTPGGTRRFPLERMHLEEDAARLVHEGKGPVRIDFNRCGTPLVEVVGAPALHTPEEAAAYLRALRRLVRWLGVSDGNMEEGSLRCDANVSVAPTLADRPGRRVELKNLNSISGVRAALHHEIARQTEVLRRGGRVEFETRSFDAAAGVTRPMRSKEEASDYRYFPEPDLPVVELSPSELEDIGALLPELPLDLHRRLVRQWGISAEEAEVLVEERALAEYFQAVVAEGIDPPLAAHWVVGEVLHLRKERGGSMESFPVEPRRIAGLLRMLERREISTAAAKKVLVHMAATADEASSLVRRMGLQLLDDEGELEHLVDAVLLENEGLVEKYRKGKGGLAGYFVGQVMQASGGRADPQRVEAMVRRRLDEGGRQ